ncbi:hypothetical protein N7519_006927 [Penicillium mononematosum]|uniref:uncharacterized protein n=1 Tax=Penicillium mononematosum TaxID=268346 RepID=UPI0025479038|nr:uncharacterized protein N7519_006927 [Penicillium mononematosum]KAJ6185626.1 hypothetical protein N7519_006927 [Penicillium mononematosum]
MSVFSECAQYIVSFEQFDNKGNPDNILAAEKRQTVEGQKIYSTAVFKSQLVRRLIDDKHIT